MSASSSALALLVIAFGVIATADSGRSSEPAKRPQPVAARSGCSAVPADERPVRVILPAMHWKPGAELSKVICNAAARAPLEPTEVSVDLAKGDRAAD